jgi:hypothetical protein
MLSKAIGLLQYASMGWNPNTLDLVTNFVRSIGGLESMYFTIQFFWITGM